MDGGFCFDPMVVTQIRRQINRSDKDPVKIWRRSTGWNSLRLRPTRSLSIGDQSDLTRNCPRSMAGHATFHSMWAGWFWVGHKPDSDRPVDTPIATNGFDIKVEHSTSVPGTKYFTSFSTFPNQMMLHQTNFYAFCLMYLRVILLFSTSNLLCLQPSIIATTLTNETDHLALLKSKESEAHDPYITFWDHGMTLCSPLHMHGYH